MIVQINYQCAVFWPHVAFLLVCVIGKCCHCPPLEEIERKGYILGIYSNFYISEGVFPHIYKQLMRISVLKSRGTHSSKYFLIYLYLFFLYTLCYFLVCIIFFKSETSSENSFICLLYTTTQRKRVRKCCNEEHFMMVC